jgi:transcriptional regulator with XRE-family HTH domain
MEKAQSVLAGNLRRLRIKSRLTQRDVAKELNVTIQAVSKWEKGKSVPDVFLLLSLSRILNCEIEDFFRSADDI